MLCTTEVHQAAAELHRALTFTLFKQGHGSLHCQLQPRNTMDDRQELPGLLPELRELRQQQIENETLIEELRKQNQQLKSILAEYNTALKKCIQMLEKPMQNGY